MNEVQKPCYINSVERGDEALAQLEMVLQNALREVRSYRAKYKATDVPTDKADILNWTLHYCATSVVSNMRLDLVAKAQASLLVNSGYRP
jgi:hypothetical protein